MELNVWNKPSGSLGEFQEGTTLNLQLPVDEVDGVNYAVISGKLPGGLWLSNDTILGTPYEVARDTISSFCVRATKQSQIADRTFTITITGPNEPVILTPSGLLDIGPFKQIFVVDDTFVNYQITAIDTDTITGQRLTYYITQGNLPPGLFLSPDGIIYGNVSAVTTLKLEEGAGTYDNGFYSSAPYDFAIPQAQNGYDELKYDYQSYDYFYFNQPRTINRIYDFVVAVTDGNTVTPPKCNFQIYVVGKNYFRADSESLISNTSVFTADVSYVQSPVWLTSSDLGTHRANNYVTIKLDVYDEHSIYYRLEEINANSIATAKRRSNNDNRKDNYIVTTELTVTAPVIGQYIKFNGSTIYNRIVNVELYSTNQYTLTMKEPLDISISDGTQFLIGTKSILPPGMKFDSISGDIFGYVPAQLAITSTYTFTVTAVRLGDADTNEFASSSKIFTVNTIGEIDSVINWTTPASLGIIEAGYESLFYINAVSTIPNSIIAYNIVNGHLPPGLSLAYDGEIIGQVRQYTNQIKFDNNSTIFDVNLNDSLITFDNQTTHFDLENTTFRAIHETTFNQSIVEPGLTTFDLSLNAGIRFDNNTTTIDRVFNFTIQASDQHQHSVTLRTFNIKVTTPNTTKYSNMYVKPFMLPRYRDKWTKFIDDPTIFIPDYIYRAYDTTFGIQRDLSMLIYAGIETKSLIEYSALTDEFSKRFRFDTIQKATAYQPGTKTAIYEVIYITMLDPKIYNTAYQSDNVTEWRNEISEMGSTKWNYLPLWMRSVQPNSRKPLGFILAVPLCYCKVGLADKVLLNIKHSNFDFKLLDYTIDRIIVNQVIGNNADKYITFEHRNFL